MTAPEELYEADLGIFGPGPGATGAGKTATRAGAPESEREKLVRGLERASESLTELIRMRQGAVMGQKEQGKKRAELEQELRLNLIALAKRAPLDMIAKMRKELLPEHLRGVVPTLD